MEDDEKICPLMAMAALMSKVGDAECLEDRCAWWQVYFKGKENEYGECAIKALSYLADMV